LFDQDLILQARPLLESCRSQGRTIATAESCTGGLLAACLTEISGASDVFERGFVVYSNAAKIAMLGVSNHILQAHGAVSRETAEAMAYGALAHAPVDYSVSITGIAGPGGSSDSKPVGLVYIGAASRSGGLLCAEHNYGEIGRARVRRSTVIDAIKLLRQIAECE
jgi:nicotinamide-nucleotide amidase